MCSLIRRRIAATLLALGLANCAGATLPDSSTDVARSRPVEIDVGALSRLSVGDTWTAPLFTDASPKLVVTRVERRAAGVSISGRVADDPLGTFSITVDHDTVAAGIWTQRGSYGLAPIGPSRPGSIARYEARQLTPRGVARCAMGARQSSIRPEVTPAHAMGHDGAPAVPPAPRGPAPRGGGCDCADDQSTLDLLVVYTALARDGAGGLGPLQARVQNAVDSMNVALGNTQLNSGGPNRLQVRLAGMSEIAYDEQAPQWINHLERVSGVDDGFMDGVHGLRDQFAADAVSLVIDDQRFTGGAGWWALWDQGSAFTCLNWRGVGAGSLLLAHELGHNFGCAHDRENDAAAPFFFAWGYSFTHAGTSYGTIMSYPGDVRVPYYSTPQLAPPPANQPIGVPLNQPRAAWNARVLAHTRWTLPSYRESGRVIDCNGNGIDDALDIAAGSSADVNDNCRPDECEVRLYVDANASGEGSGASWADPIKDLNAAFDLAALRCGNVREIWVADGVYTPRTGSRFSSFDLRSGLFVLGGFQGASRPGGGETSADQRTTGAFPSVLSGDIGVPGDPSDNAFSVVEAQGVGDNTLLDGFVIRDGGAIDSAGGGLYAANSSLRVRGCVFTANLGAYGGAAIVDGLGTPVFEGCTFADNAAANSGGAIWIGNGTDVTFDRCTFTGNQANWGGAIVANESTVMVRSSVFTGNATTGAQGGAIYVFDGVFGLLNSVLAGNAAAADAGAAWLSSSATSTITNCTIYGNTTGATTGGVVASFSHLDLANTVLWGNTGAGASEQRQIVYFGATGAPRYSRVQGWTGALGGTGNSGADPLLTNPAGGDWSPRPGSSCIDAGDTPALAASVTLDAAGRARRVDDPATSDSGVGPAPVVDIGAMEYQPPACRADFNGDGAANSQDFFDFLAAFFGALPSADFNTDGAINSQDFFDFLGEFFEGC